MNDLLVYETYTKGNIDNTERIEIKIFTHKPISESTLKIINTMPYYEVERLSHAYEWKIWRKN